MKINRILAFAFFLLSYSIFCAFVECRKLKVLLFSPQIGYSHLQFIASIADTLADVGHEVHILEILFNSHWRNFTNYRHSTHRIIHLYPNPDEISRDVRDIKMFQRPFDGQFNGIFEGIWEDWFDYWPLYCQYYLKQDALFRELSVEQYDLAMTELYDFCPLGIFHHIGIRSVVAGSAIPLTQVLSAHFGIPTIPSFMTSLMAPVKNGPLLSFSERFFNFYTNIYEKWFLLKRPYDKQQILFFQKFGSNFPLLKDLVRNVSFIFVNTFDNYELPRPTVPKVVNIGGIVENNWAVTEIDLESERILEDPKVKNAVYFSFGSITDLNLLSDPLKKAFLQTFLHFPDFEFIWKMENNEKQQNGESADAKSAFKSVRNLHLLKWVNQRAILTHPKVRAFITHCGRNSMNEAAIAGVPLVALPLFADQPYNAMIARHKGIAEFVNIAELANAPNLLIEALEKILTDDRFLHNAIILKRQIALSPFSASQKLVRNIEFAAEFGVDGGLSNWNIPTEEEVGGYLIYNSLDVILISVGSLISFLPITFLLFRLFRQQ